MTPLASATAPADVPPPPATFNFAQHLLKANAGRPEKIAFVDELGSLSYGALEERVRRVAGGLRSLGIKREERVLLLMLDGTDWPVSFLGAMYAGLVPVAVNTLLTADDYAFMLEHSRAQAVLVSGVLFGNATTMSWQTGAQSGSITPGAFWRSVTSSGISPRNRLAMP